jgi:hypothetical protein
VREPGAELNLRDHLADVAGEARLVELVQARAQVDEDLGRLLAAAVDGGEHELEQAVAHARRHVRDHAEVHQHQLGLVGEQHVARVRVGVDDAVHEHLVQVRAHQVGAQLAQRHLGARDRRDVRHLGPPHHLHRQHALRGVVPDRLGHAQVRVRRQVLGEDFEVLRLALVVELGQQHAAELLDPVAEAVLVVHAAEAADGAGDGAQQVEVGDDAGADVGPLHLDRHLAAVGQDRVVHLAQRRGADRRFVELLEQLVELQAELGLDHRAHRVERHRLDRILHALEARPGIRAARSRRGWTAPARS